MISTDTAKTTQATHQYHLEDSAGVETLLAELLTELVHFSLGNNRVGAILVVAHFLHQVAVCPHEMHHQPHGKSVELASTWKLEISAVHKSATQIFHMHFTMIDLTVGWKANLLHALHIQQTLTSC
jgi:hypothetical protein